MAWRKGYTDDDMEQQAIPEEHFLETHPRLRRVRNWGSRNTALETVLLALYLSPTVFVVAKDSVGIGLVACAAFVTFWAGSFRQLPKTRLKRGFVASGAVIATFHITDAPSYVAKACRPRS